MRYLIFFFLLFPFSAFSQPEGSPDWDTSYINTVVATDTTYFVVTDSKWFDDDGNLLFRDLNEELIGKDTTQVYSFLIEKISERVKYESRAIKTAYEFRNLGSESDLLSTFSGLPYWAHMTLRYSAAIDGDYKVIINGTNYDATIQPNGNGVLRLDIPTVGNYAVYPEGLTKFQVRNFEPSHIDFYFIESRQWGDNILQVFRPKDDSRFVIAKIK